jgi:hypothetical protein
MIDGSSLSRGSRVVWTTTKVAVAVGLLSLVAARWLSHGPLDQQTLLRLAAGGRVEEPTMTGTLAKARQTTLDPCVAQKRP